jgi:hypothetical protein
MARKAVPIGVDRCFGTVTRGTEPPEALLLLER